MKMTIINAALLPTWTGSDLDLEHIYPGYNGIVPITRRKIINGVLTIQNNQWIDSENDMSIVTSHNT